MDAGAQYLIAFNEKVIVVTSGQAESDLFEGLNAGIKGILANKLSPVAATEHIRENFRVRIEDLWHNPDRDGGSWAWLAPVRRAFLRSNALALQFHGQDAITCLRTIKAGRRQASEYHVLSARILEETLSPHLSEPHSEVTTEERQSRYDTVFMNRAEAGFWHDIKVSRGNSVVVFDAKNKRRLSPADADQMLRYSGRWRGSVVFVITRSEPSASFLRRTADLLKEKDVCLLVLSDKELEEMLLLKHQGDDPTIVVERLYRENRDGMMTRRHGPERSIAVRESSLNAGMPLRRHRSYLRNASHRVRVSGPSRTSADGELMLRP